MRGFVLCLQQAEPCLCWLLSDSSGAGSNKSSWSGCQSCWGCFFSHDITGKEDDDSFQRCAVKISTPQREKVVVVAVVVVQYRVPVPSIVVGFPPVRMFRCDGQDPKLQAGGGPSLIKLITCLYEPQLPGQETRKSTICVGRKNHRAAQAGKDLKGSPGQTLCGKGSLGETILRTL